MNEVDASGAGLFGGRGFRFIAAAKGVEFLLSFGVHFVRFGLVALLEFGGGDFLFPPDFL